jgi:hypothetical protein
LESGVVWVKISWCDRGIVGRAGKSCIGVMLVCMRDPEIIEAELIEISAIADDSIKLERIVAWCATHPDEVPFALHHLMSWRD